MFIVFEGPDLVGKTTQAKLLVERLRSAGGEVLHLAFPSKEAFGAAARTCLTLRDLPLAEQTRAVVTQACLLADRYAATPEIQQQLARGRIVVVERWTLSGLVYGEVDGLERQMIQAAQAGLVVPDLEIVLTASAAALQQRKAERGDLDRYEVGSFTRRILSGYGRYSLPSPSRLVLDGETDRDALAKRLWGYVSTLLRRRWG